MKNNGTKILVARKTEVAQRTDHTQAVANGGLAIIHQLVNHCGLIDALNAVQVLKLKMPYFESDHIMNIVYNFLCGSTALEHIEYRRQDPIHLNMPLDTLNANWMYLVCGCLAWSLKSWLTLLIDVVNRQESKSHRWRLLTMEFRTFLQAMVMLPAQVLQSGRRVVVRFLNVNDWTATFFVLVDSLKSLRLVRRE